MCVSVAPATLIINPGDPGREAPQQLLICQQGWQGANILLPGQRERRVAAAAGRKGEVPLVYSQAHGPVICATRVRDSHKHNTPRRTSSLPTAQLCVGTGLKTHTRIHTTLPPHNGEP